MAGALNAAVPLEEPAGTSLQPTSRCLACRALSTRTCILPNLIPGECFACMQSASYNQHIAYQSADGCRPLPAATRLSQCRCLLGSLSADRRPCLLQECPHLSTGCCPHCSRDRGHCQQQPPPGRGEGDIAGRLTGQLCLHPLSLQALRVDLA